MQSRRQNNQRSNSQIPTSKKSLLYSVLGLVYFPQVKSINFPAVLLDTHQSWPVLRR